MMSSTPTLGPLCVTQQGMKKSILAHQGTPVPKVSHLTPKEWLGSLHWWRKKQMQDPGKGDCGCYGVVKWGSKDGGLACPGYKHTKRLMILTTNMGMGV